MTVERRNPLPIGRYWHNVVELPDKPNARAAFVGWINKNKSVHVEVTTDHPDDEPPSVFYIFAVTAPTVWEGPGYPTIATDKVKSQGDTEQGPPPTPSLANQVEAAVDKAGTGIATGVKVVAVLGGIALFVWLLSRKGNAAGS
jgi:hypothetical protein